MSASPVSEKVDSFLTRHSHVIGTLLGYANGALLVLAWHSQYWSLRILSVVSLTFVMQSAIYNDRAYRAYRHFLVTVKGMLNKRAARQLFEVAEVAHDVQHRRP